MTSLFLPAPVRQSTNQAPNNNTQTSQHPPIQTIDAIQDVSASASATNNRANPATPLRAPTYEQRCRAAIEFSKLTPEQQKAQTKKLFVPRSIADFDDGGAFPEIHVAQYPKHMGNPHLARAAMRSGADGQVNGNINGNSNSSRPRSNPLQDAALSTSTTRSLALVQINAAGEKDYTSLVRTGTNANRKVYAHHGDLRGYKPSQEEITLPSADQEAETASRTQAAIDALLSDKIAMSKPSGTALQNAASSRNQEEKTQFIEYTANPNAPGYNPAAARRVIQMVPAQIDPMMPPKHKHLKAPPGPAEDFVPVLHAPPEKLSKEEREAWNIPACISNWKNTRGYTIPLDKRLAADGRGLRDDTTINPNFATLSESLYLAERQAREEVRLRSLVQKRQAESERERRERELRELAMKARMSRSGVVMHSDSHEGEGLDESRFQHHQQQDDNNFEEEASHDSAVVPMRNTTATDQDDEENSHHDHNNERASTVHKIVDDDESRFEAEKRERIRQERRRERERELRMEKYRPSKYRGGAEEEEEDVAIKKARLGDRDISEKIALGVHTGSGGVGGGLGGIDGRLYNQNAGLDSGFGADDEYNTYTKPMFDREGVTSSSIYRPTRGEAAMDADEQYAKLKAGATSRFQPDKGFSGAEGGGVGGVASSGGRNAPVQFEKGE